MARQRWPYRRLPAWYDRLTWCACAAHDYHGRIAHGLVAHAAVSQMRWAIGEVPSTRLTRRVGSRYTRSLCCDRAACGMVCRRNRVQSASLPIGSDHQSDRDHEALRVPELRSAALFREYEVRKLWPAAGLSAEAGSRHCIGSGRWRLERARDAGERYRLCGNAEHDVCNWLVPADDAEIFCAACRHNRTIPDLANPENLVHWRKIEFAKHRLFYTLLRLRLPLATRSEDANGLAFDFLSNPVGGAQGQAPVMTGHSGGLITLNVAEADAPERERQRKTMGEPYRTLLGHFRHEIGHYYWDRLVADSPAIEEFRQLFGDEREDYGAALQRHYADGPAPDWTEHFVTAYASSHPWEDFAETWA